MTIEELRQLPDVTVITKADVLEIARHIATELQTRTLNKSEATIAYGIDGRTLEKRIKAGVIKGFKDGGEWCIETPAHRANRLFN